MSDFKHFLRDVGYFSIGAVAAVAEAGGKAVKALVSKGEKTLQDNQETVNEFKRKTRELGDRMKATMEKAAAKPAAPVDAAAMTPEERAELRRQLDEADLADAQPVEADVIYHAEEPASEAAEAAEPEAPEAAEEPTPEEDPVAQEPPVLEVPEEDDPRDPFTRY